MNLLMSGFLDIPRGHAHASSPQVKTISGAFPLTRKSSSDRPGGIIHLTAFLHMPECSQAGRSADDSQVMLQQERHDHLSRQERSRNDKQRPSTAAPEPGAMGTACARDSGVSALPVPKCSVLITPPRFRRAAASASQTHVGSDGRPVDHHHPSQSFSVLSSSTRHSPSTDNDQTPPVNPLAAGTPSVRRSPAITHTPSTAHSRVMRSPISGGDEQNRRRPLTALDAYRAGHDQDAKEGSSSSLAMSQGNASSSNPFQGILDHENSYHTAHFKEANAMGFADIAHPIGSASGSVPPSTMHMQRTNYVGETRERGVAVPPRPSTTDSMRQSRLSMQFQQLDILASSLQTDADSAVENLSRKLKKRACKSEVGTYADSSALSEDGGGKGKIHRDVSSYGMHVDHKAILSSNVHPKEGGGRSAAVWKTHQKGITLRENVEDDSNRDTAPTSAAAKTEEAASSTNRKLVLGVRNKDSLAPVPTSTTLADADKLLAKFDQRLHRRIDK